MMWKKTILLALFTLCGVKLLCQGSNSDTVTNPSSLSPIDEIIAIEGPYGKIGVSDQHSSFMNYYPASSAQWRIVSLSNLIENLKQDQTRNSAVFPLDQLGWIEGYVIDREKNDLLLFGREMSSWPVLYLDELLQLDELLLKGSSYPYCSLDPLPENVLAFNKAISQKDGSMDNQTYYNNLRDAWGPQAVVVGGVTPKSSIALIMLNADYHMKKLSQGHVRVTPLESLMDIRLDSSNDNQKNSAGKPNSSRFWFNCKKGDPVIHHAEDIAILESCDVILLTEAQASSSSGELYDSGEDDPLANLWASSFSREFKSMATQVEVYAQLENLYRLYAVMQALEYNHHLSYANDFFYSLAEANPLQRVYDIPDSYPGLVNLKMDTTFMDERSYQISTVFVCGGVSMEISVTEEKVHYTSTLPELADYIKQSRPDFRASSWTLSSPVEVGQARFYKGGINTQLKPRQLDPLPNYLKPGK